jgi:hypothetical protein
MTVGHPEAVRAHYARQVVGPTSSPSVEIFEIRKLVQRFKRIKLAFAVNFVVCKSAKTKDLGTGLFRKNDCKSLSASQVTNFLLSTIVALLVGAVNLMELLQYLLVLERLVW